MRENNLMQAQGGRHIQLPFRGLVPLVLMKSRCLFTFLLKALQIVFQQFTFYTMFVYTYCVMRHSNICTYYVCNYVQEVLYICVFDNQVFIYHISPFVKSLSLLFFSKYANCFQNNCNVSSIAGVLKLSRPPIIRLLRFVATDSRD